MIRQFSTHHEPYDDPVQDSPIVKLWYGLLGYYLKRGYERIHIAPSDSPDTFTVRACTQGAWEQIMTPQIQLYRPFLQRLKVMASLSLAKRLSTEQGRFRLAVRDSVYEIGVTVQVRPNGEQEAMIELPSQPVKGGDE
jgi:type II secretory ATPase GspE/PulE/Tfp pilus assembly ATPase PilB-like protein